MKMRERTIRGKKYRLRTGEEVIALEAIEDSVKVLLPSEKIATCPKDDLNLTIIDTKNYEKITRPDGFDGLA